MKYLYSPSTNGFYPTELKEDYENAGLWPADGLPVDDNVFDEYSGTPPLEKIRGAGGGGIPTWIDVPPPTADELIHAAEATKRSLLSESANVISLLSDAVDLGMATTEEIRRYDEWRRYRVLISRVDTSKVQGIDWPQRPAQ